MLPRDPRYCLIGAPAGAAAGAAAGVAAGGGFWLEGCSALAGCNAGASDGVAPPLAEVVASFFICSNVCS